MIQITIEMYLNKLFFFFKKEENVNSTEERRTKILSTGKCQADDS